MEQEWSDPRLLTLMGEARERGYFVVVAPEKRGFKARLHSRGGLTSDFEARGETAIDAVANVLAMVSQAKPAGEPPPA